MTKDLKTDMTEGEEVLLREDLGPCRLTLTLQNDGMECLAAVEKTASDPAASTGPDSAGSQEARCSLAPPDLLCCLHRVKIVQTIDYAAVYELCAAVELGQPLSPVVVARGIPPLKGADGWFELLVKTGSEGVALEEDEKGTVDLKNLNIFSEIQSGQKLGVVHPPGSGIAGMTVQGLPVPADSGKPYQLVAGDGVTLKYKDRVAYSDKSGKAILEQQTLAVVDHWVIPGDLDLSIGNIEFHGYVEIKGDVPDDFRVVAEKGIKVHGHVGASHLESDGSIELVSMAGREVGTIICRGNLRANFLNQVKVVSFGHVTVANEVRNCQIKSTGRLMVERGALLGGTCTTLEGVEAKVIGSESGLKTEVTAGVYFPDADRFNYLLERKQNVTQQLARLAEAIDQLNSSLARNVQYAAAARKRLDILSEQHELLTEEKERLSAEIASSRCQEFTCRNAKINVTSRLMEGVVLILGGSREEIRMVRSGPLSIIENTRDGGVRFLAMTPLSLLADVVEQQLLDSPEDPTP